MLLCSKNGEVIDFKDYSPSKKGLRSDYYSHKDGETGLRIYHKSNPIVKTINVDHFNALKEIKHDALPELGEVYYNTYDITPFDQVKAYTCENIERSTIDLNDKDALADKLVGRILSAGTVLAENGYSLSIPQYNDIVIGENGAYLIDPNKIIKEKNLTTEELIRINQLVALKYVKYGIINSLRESVKQGDESLIIVPDMPVFEKTLELVNKMSA